MVVVVQLVRTPDCGSGGRRFESGLPPKSKPSRYRGFFCCSNYWMSSDIINYLFTQSSIVLKTEHKPSAFLVKEYSTFGGIC